MPFAVFVLFVFGTNNAVRAIFDVSDFRSNSIGSILLKANFGATKPVASVMIRPVAINFMTGKIEILAVGDGATNAQRVNLSVDLVEQRANFSSILYAVRHFGTGTAAEDSNASVILGLTSRESDNDATNRLEVATYVVEKIT